uniref:RxLR effector protein n=1 Tax=Phytophthora sojae TaxID=67593 RepID=G1FR60_PHYSO|nr:Avh67 [Phytophthora sojae]AEK80599.1 Avh67 [Phytophthora sojae]
MRFYVTVLVVAACLVASSHALPADQAAVSRATSLTEAFSVVDKEGVEEKRRLRFKSTNKGKEDDANEEVEERGGGFNLDLTGVGNLFKAKDPQGIADAAKKAASMEFWGKVANRLSFRRERFPSWQKDGMEVNSIIAQLKAHGFTGKNFDEIAKKYAHFKQTGEIL